MKLSRTRRIGAVAIALALGICSGGSARLAHGDDGVDPSSDAFSCATEARMFVQEHSAAEVRAERDHWLTVRADLDEPAVVTGHRWCVVAELMRWLGDHRASLYYARAIAATRDPGYELRLAEYFRVARGPRIALGEQAEQHYLAALAGVRARADNPGASDDAIAERATRGLMLTRQQDGLTVLPWTAVPSGASSVWRGSRRPGLAVMVGGRIAFDTNDTPLDASSPPQVDDVRRFTAEAMLAASALRNGRPLRTNELQAIARAPRRDEVMARARFRSWPIGALDLWYRRSHIDGGELMDVRSPMRVNDVAQSELGAGLARAVDLAPAFDALLAGNYRRIDRLGAAEFGMFEVGPAIARFLGPDKLSFATTYAVMAIPDARDGVIADRARGRKISSLDVDYVLNRLPALPFQWPALRLFAGGSRDDETFGTRVVRRRDAYIGLSAPGLHRWDVRVQVSRFTTAVDSEPQDPAQLTGEDPQQSHAQVRTTLVFLRRVLDEDAWPGLPPEVHGVRPSMLHAVVTLRSDVAIRGLSAYQNVRGGVELWGKAFVTGLRKAAVMISAGYDNQYFYVIGKDLHIIHLDMRMGW